MTESLSATVLWGMFLFFVAVWAAILGLGYLLSFRDDGGTPEPVTSVSHLLHRN